MPIFGQSRSNFALKGLRNVIPYAGQNFMCKKEMELLLAVMCSAAGVENVSLTYYATEHAVMIASNVIHI